MEAPDICGSLCLAQIEVDFNALSTYDKLVCGAYVTVLFFSLENMSILYALLKNTIMQYVAVQLVSKSLFYFKTINLAYV